MAPGTLTESSSQTCGPSTLTNYEENRFSDLENEFDPDGSLDNDFYTSHQGKVIDKEDKRPGTLSDVDVDTHDKRSHPEDGDEDIREGSGKRRERKLGRKPISSEPTSKRKAQNRAAQRAFRERKEKYLKDLEMKVEDLEKASESTNHENCFLRAQIEKMSAELREYQKRFSLSKNINSSSLVNTYPTYLSGGGVNENSNASGPNDVNFEFEFTKFGRFPAPPVTTNIARNSSSAQPISLATFNRQMTPRSQTIPFRATETSSEDLTQITNQPSETDISSLPGRMFNNTLLESFNISPSFNLFEIDDFNAKTKTKTKANTMNEEKAQADTQHDKPNRGLKDSLNSPSTTSDRQESSSPSCRASPIPTLQSPVHDKSSELTLKTTGEEDMCVPVEAGLVYCEGSNYSFSREGSSLDIQANPPSLDLSSFYPNGIDFLAQQNGNQFSPQLYDNYREPQDSVLSGDVLNDSLFTDTFTMPMFHNILNSAPNTPFSKKDAVATRDDKQGKEEAVECKEDTKNWLSCRSVWDRTQACPIVKNSDLDLEGLCKDLQKKAKCSRSKEI